MNCGPKGCPTPETCRRKGMCCGTGMNGYVKPAMNAGKPLPVVKRSTKSVQKLK